MSDMVTLSVRGDKAVMKRLRKLPRTVAKKVITRSARVAMKPMLKAARDNAPSKTGAMRKAIKLYALKKNRRGDIGVMISLNNKKKWYAGETFYGAFQEFGWHIGKRSTALRDYIDKTGEDPRGFVPGKHFLERAYDTHSEQALRTFLDEVPRQIETAMATGGK